MRGLTLERPPRWGIVVLAVLVVVNIALFSFVLLRPQTSPDAPQVAASTRSAGGAATSAPAATGSAAPTSPEPPDAPRVLAVYGDGYAAGNEQGGIGPAGWPALVAAATNSTLQLNAVARAGYASVGTSGQDMVGLVQDAPVPDATVTVLFGSRNDGGQTTEVVRQNADEALALVRQAAPTTVIVVVGPVWDDGDVPVDVIAARDAVRDAATAAGVGFIDPIAERWFADESELISSDGVSPTDAGHAYLAGLLTPAVDAALDRG